MTATHNRRTVMMGMLGSAAAVNLPIATNAQSTSTTTAVRSGPQSAAWSEPLTRYITQSQTAPLSEETVELAKRHFLDTLASVVACRDLDTAVIGRRFALAQSAGAKVAPLLGTRERATLLDAILASGMAAHGAEINDFCPSAFVQPGASIIPTVLCLGDARNASGNAVFRAMIVGYELSCRLPKALGIRNLRNGVLANHSVGPIFGSAAAAASLIGLPADRMNNLYSYFVQQASGSWQWLRDVEHIEKSFVFGGMPARRGVECALMAESGFTGVGDPFVGDPGWLNSSLFTGPQSDFNPAYLVTELGKRTEFPLIAYKRYPVGGPTQPVIELMLGLVKEIPAKRVRNVRIEMPGRTGAFAAAEMPALNLPYLCSIILADGKLDFVAAQSRQRFLNDKAIRAFMPNVQVIHDPKQEAEPRIESARVILTLDDGTKVERFIEHVKGFPEHPFDRDDVLNKARELMTPHLGDKRTESVIAAVWNIENIKAKELTRLIAR
jgi:2-methylcitrate dehydratase PrpD